MNLYSHRTTLGLGVALALAGLAHANGNALTDAFEGGQNAGGWSFNVTTPDVLETTGGNPGGWLHNDFVSSFAPRLTTTGAPSLITGDLRAMGVTKISFDARTDFSSFGANGFPMSILLRDTKGTPANPDDDDYAYYVAGQNVPLPGEGWVHYDFPIPSQDTSAVPAGWSGGHSGDLENFRPGVTWNDVITNVDKIEIWWIHPAWFAIFQTWDVGVDNMAVTRTVGDEPFEGGNAGAWSFNVTNPDVMETTGGNPGGWLHNDFVSSFAPRLTTNEQHPLFTGDLRAMGVTKMRFDARSDFISFGGNGFPMSILLRDTKGTPANLDDDDYAYYVSPQNVPLPGDGWVHYEIPIPSADTSAVPAGWSGGHSGDVENFRPGVTWNDVITNVDRVEVWWIHPAWVAIFQTWDVGVDNMAFEYGAAASASVRNGSGANPLTLSNGTVPVLGATWNASLDCSGHASGGMAILLGHAAPASGLFAPAGELLIDLTSGKLFSFLLPHSGGAAGFANLIPDDPALCGLQAFVQGACTGAPGVALSNALDMTVGL